MQPGGLRVRFLVEKDKNERGPEVCEEDMHIHRLHVRFEDFLTCGFTKGCPGCHAMLTERLVKAMPNHVADRSMRLSGHLLDVEYGCPASRHAGTRSSPGGRGGARSEEEARRKDERGEKRRETEESRETQLSKKGRPRSVANPSSSSPNQCWANCGCGSGEGRYERSRKRTRLRSKFIWAALPRKLAQCGANPCGRGWKRWGAPRD